MRQRGTPRGAALFGMGVALLAALVRLRAAPDGGADVDAPAWEPAALSRLAAWEPAPPRTGWQRVVGLLWAAPMSAAGLIAGLASLRAPVARDGVLLFAGARGPTALALRRRGFAAAALGHVVLALGEPTRDLLAHELVHVRQAERLGILMAPAYLGMLAAYGYRRHPLERAARRAGARIAASGDAPPV